MAVIQYPDTAVYTIPGTPVQDSGGVFAASGATSYTTTCRAEYNSRSGTVTMPDGKTISYDYAVYQPVHTTEIAPGSTVVITLHNGRTVNGTVKRHENNQLNSKSWV
jgi:hypothetical protein